MTISCELVRDLLPLYDDGVISHDGHKIVSTHLGRCAACRAYHKQVKESELAATEYLKKEPIPADGEKDFRPLARRYKRKRILYWAAAAALTAVYAGTLIYCISKLADNGDKK